MNILLYTKDNGRWDVYIDQDRHLGTWEGACSITI